MNIVDVCIIAYPGQVEAGNITFRQPEDEILIQSWKVEGVPEPTVQELLNMIPELEPVYQLNLLKIASKGLLQNLIDTTAQQKTYADALHCVSYGLSTNVQWNAEALAFIAWRDSVYEKALQILASVEQGAPVPTEQEFLAELPKIVWPN